MKIECPYCQSTAYDVIDNDGSLNDGWLIDYCVCSCGACFELSVEFLPTDVKIKCSTQK